jgi:hypothetical protein
MALAQLFTPIVEISIGGKVWPVLFTHRVILAVEGATGLSSIDGTLDLHRLSAKALRTLLGVALHSAGCPMTVAQIGETMQPRAITAYKQRLWEAWRNAMPEPEPSVHYGGKNSTKEPPKTRSWMQTWANNRTLLNLTDEEWLEMTPRMVQALSREKMERIRQDEYMLSKLLAATINFSMCHPEKPVPEDYGMIHPWPKQWNLRASDNPAEDVIKQFAQFKDMKVAKKIVENIH